MFSTGTAVSSTDKAEILLTIVLNTDQNNPKRITGQLFKYVYNSVSLYTNIYSQF